MGATKLLKQQMQMQKDDMKARYLAGEAVLSIARSYEVSDRAIYYHLGVLTADEQALHAKNMKLRRTAAKQARSSDPVNAETIVVTKENFRDPMEVSNEIAEGIRKEEQDAEESPVKKPGSSLADFVE